ncbi:MAG TPA: hypothetical protein VHJ78_12585 [Actinomycetota bacterium]|nr:hypothetical protein [Actinomycetota bacterium]
MPQCAHGIDMNSTCSKCGRFKVGSAGNFEAKKNGFLRSIDRLEETVRRMQAELAKGPVNIPGPQDDEPDAEQESPPPAPPQRYPWQRG